MKALVNLREHTHQIVCEFFNSATTDVCVRLKEVGSFLGRYEDLETDIWVTALSGLGGQDLIDNFPLRAHAPTVKEITKDCSDGIAVDCLLDFSSPEAQKWIKQTVANLRELLSKHGDNLEQLKSSGLVPIEKIPVEILRRSRQFEALEMKYFLKGKDGRPSGMVAG